MMTYNELRKNADIRTYIEAADASLDVLGYTRHSFEHVTKVAEMTGYILEELGCDAHTAELGRIAAYLHDIGNMVNRTDHAQSGAVIAFTLLDKLSFGAADIAAIVTAIGNHDETEGMPVSAVAAALILADKADVRRSRVRSHDREGFDIHDRVNYSVIESSLKVAKGDGKVTLSLTIDTDVSSVTEYFEIFLKRMLFCKKAAAFFGLRFELVMNGQTMM